MRQAKTAVSFSVDQVVDSYWRFLARNHYDAHLKRFKDRLKADQKAAEAEAIVFALLWSEKLHPDAYEDTGTGGPDFRCNPSPDEPFLVEATSLDSISLSNKSGLPLKLTGAGGQAFSLVTAKLRSAAQGKATQLGGHDMPGVLAITSAYDFAGLLMDRMAAHNLLTSDLQIRVPFGMSGESSYMTTDLRHAVFCRPTILDASGDQMFS